MIGADLAPLELAGRLALALSLAAFIGLAFEEVYKREDRSTPGGVRTFPMLALSGAMLYLIEPRHALAFVVGLIALAFWLHASLRNAPPGPNTTTLMIPASNLVAYVLGPVALTQPPWLVVAVSVTAVLLLGTREQLHGLIKVIPQDELLTAGKFLILVGIVLPLVPNQPLIAVTPLTPYHVWLAVVAVCTLSYISYLLQKYAPVRNATLVPAILGGIYSSTATTVVLAKRSGRRPLRFCGGDRGRNGDDVPASGNNHRSVQLAPLGLPVPDARIGALTNRYFFAVALQGVMQIVTIIAMARLATGV